MSQAKYSFQNGFESVAKVGTCLLACMLTRKDKSTRAIIANMGDCQMAVLSKECKLWSGRTLTAIQNANNCDEVQFLQELHPGEPDLLLRKNHAN